MEERVESTALSGREEWMYVPRGGLGAAARSGGVRGWRTCRQAARDVNVRVFVRVPSVEAEHGGESG